MLLEGLNKPGGEGSPTGTAMSTLGRNAQFSAANRTTKQRQTKQNPTQKLGKIKQGLERKVQKTKYH